MKALDNCYLYGFIDAAYLRSRDPVLVAIQLCRGGADIIQLRAKDWTAEEIHSVSEKIQPILANENVLFVVNDHPEIAHACNADICHLGQEDFFDQNFTHARQLFPQESNCRLGLSTHAPEQARRAIDAEPAYIAIGPVYATSTKPTAKPVTLDYVSWARQHAKIPWFAIGGVNRRTIDDVLAAGAKRVCVVSDILEASDLEEACRFFKTKLHSTR